MHDSVMYVWVDPEAGIIFEDGASALSRNIIGFTEPDPNTLLPCLRFRGVRLQKCKQSLDQLPLSF